MKMMKQKSFTLIELLVAIAIVGLLASIVLVNINLPGKKEKARIAKVLEFSQSVQSALGSEAVGIWNFDEGSGTIAKDSSGYGKDGVISGASYVSDTPQKIVGTGSGKYSLSFNGVDDYVNAGLVNGINGAAALTTEFWIKPGLQGVIIQSGGWAYAIQFYNGYLYTYYASPGNIYGRITFSGAGIKANEWVHIAAVYDGSGATNSDKAKLYINGVRKVLGYNGVIPSALNTGANNLIIGYHDTYYFNGLLDEVRIYSQALSVGQIQKHYAEGLKKYGVQF